ncbi:hypothetical protein H0H93_005574 [Arthromyces matolae]|nr:hypothetical protein H0H93_005574 [Arthromyces matolae]
MPNPMLNSRAIRPVGLGRNHDYNAIYEPDPAGQEASENARVWRVYLDEADAYDADMISSFETILDSLLASLFSAVVTTFVAQTSQVLQPDNAQITVAILAETNQLLRAAGNSTKIDSVSPSSLGPNSPTHTSTDLWINGLFFTSLTLSVATALLSVLAKQWIQAYIQIVPGTAKTQTMIRQFRFDGLHRWKLGPIIEGLPLILHTSVAIFLVGLSLYISQLSRPVCVILSSITALTFVFYLVTSMIPAFSIDCPFRLSSIFLVARFLRILAHAIRRAFFDLLVRIFPRVRRVIPSRYYFQIRAPPETLRKEEYNEAMASSQHWSSLMWLFVHSTNNSTKDIVLEGISGILDELSGSVYKADDVSQPIAASLLAHALVYSSHLQTELEEKSNSDTIIESKWDTFINKVLLAKPRLPALELVPWEQERFWIQIWKRYVATWQAENLGLSKDCLSNLHKTGIKVLRSYLARRGNQHNIRCAMDDNTREIFLRRDHAGATLLHHAATWGNLEVVIALLATNPELIDAQTPPPFSLTALQCAICAVHPDPRIVEYLLDHGASAPPSILHFAASNGKTEAIVTLLDRGWDRTVKDKSGATPIDLACIEKANYDSAEETDFITERYIKAIDYLENYQTVPLPHPSILADGGAAESGNQSLNFQVIPRDKGTYVKTEMGVEPLAEGVKESVH